MRSQYPNPKAQILGLALSTCFLLKPSLIHNSNLRVFHFDVSARLHSGQFTPYSFFKVGTFFPISTILCDNEACFVKNAAIVWNFLFQPALKGTRRFSYFQKTAQMCDKYGASHWQVLEPSRVHRIVFTDSSSLILSQNHLGRKWSLRSLSAIFQQPLPYQPQHSTKGHVQLFLQHPQGWLHHHLPGQSFPMLDSPFQEEILHYLNFFSDGIDQTEQKNCIQTKLPNTHKPASWAEI